jgi:hypothetical protein
MSRPLHVCLRVHTERCRLRLTAVVSIGAHETPATDETQHYPHAAGRFPIGGRAVVSW